MVAGWRAERQEVGMEDFDGGVGEVREMEAEVRALRQEVHKARFLYHRGKTKEAKQVLENQRETKTRETQEDLDAALMETVTTTTTATEVQVMPGSVLDRIERAWCRVQELEAGGEALVRLKRQARRLRGEGYCVLGALERALVGDTKRAAECFVMAAESAEDNLEVLRESGAALRSFPTRCHIAARMHIRALDLDPKDDCSRRELACSLNDLGTFLKANGPGCVTEDCARACLEAVDSCLGGTKAATDAGAIRLDSSGGLKRDSIGVGKPAAGDSSPLYERVYHAALATSDSYAPVWYNLGVLAGERLEHQRAESCYRRCLELDPRHAECLCNLGALLRRNGDAEGAVSLFERSLSASPNHHMIRANLAAALCDLGARAKQEGGGGGEGLRRATEAYERALALEPANPLVLYNLGVAYSELGQKDRSVAMYELCLRFHPQYAEAWNNLGVLLRDRGNEERAIRCYEEAARLNPKFGQPLNNLGIVFAGRGEVRRSKNAFEAAIAASPDYAEVHNNLGVLHRDVGDMTECLTSYKRCLFLDPKNRSAGHNLLMGLNYVKCGEEEDVCLAHEEWGEAFARDRRGQLPPLRPVPPRRPGQKGDEEDEEDEEEASSSGSYANSPTQVGSHPVLADPSRVPVVGYLSPDLFTHSVSYFAEAPITKHSPETRVFVYDVTPNPDAKSQRLRDLSPSNVTWRCCRGMEEADVARLVRKDGVDILVELTGHTANNRLGVLAMRAAPVQATWIGYPNSTGLKECDYRITDDVTDPDPSTGRTRQTYVERLERLEGCFLCYTPSHTAPEVAALPSEILGTFTFGTFNALAKVTEGVVKVWCEILRRTPGSRLVIKSKPFACEDGRRRYEHLFQKHGIDAADRVDLIPLVASTEGHLAVYGHVDLALDPWPYAGTTTTCEAMYMGVPTVTLRGRCHAQNVGHTLMKAVGLDGSGKCPSENFVASSEREYADLAVQWAQESRRPELSALRASLRDRMMTSPLCDARGFLRNLEGVYARWWGDYCEGVRAEMTKRGEGSEDNDSDASGESSQAVAMAEQ